MHINIPCRRRRWKIEQLRNFTEKASRNWWFFCFVGFALCSRRNRGWAEFGFPSYKYDPWKQRNSMLYIFGNVDLTKIYFLKSKVLCPLSFCSWLRIFVSYLITSIDASLAGSQREKILWSHYKPFNNRVSKDSVLQIKIHGNFNRAASSWKEWIPTFSPNW